MTFRSLYYTMYIQLKDDIKLFQNHKENMSDFDITNRKNDITEYLYDLLESDYMAFLEILCLAKKNNLNITLYLNNKIYNTWYGNSLQNLVKNKVK